MAVDALRNSPVPQPSAAADALARYRNVRAQSLRLAAPLSAEDQCVQSMPDASPTKWHLAHTTWFFETVLLQRHDPRYRPFDPRFQYLFNSYYEALGARHPRPRRGLLTRPALDEVLAYRRHVDAAMDFLLATIGAAAWRSLEPIVALGLAHEEQHQELIVTDILHAFSINPLLPAYQPVAVAAVSARAEPPAARWIERPGGVVAVGHRGEAGFAFDNETPRHEVLLQPYAIADRLVNCSDYLRFIEDGGYERPELWLSDGWAACQAGDWRHPAYWFAPGDERLQRWRPAATAAHATAESDGWHVFGLHGVQPLDAPSPVAQLSFYEAAAYAEWAGARLPTEFEWEAAFDAPGMRQMTGEVWQWTRSAYDPYPGFRPLSGIASEYNGKFMVGQVVLRGGSAATPDGHTRPTYRNFFPPGARWQFSGVRLARSLT